jgi:hypothetical protein
MTKELPVKSYRDSRVFDELGATPEQNKIILHNSFKGPDFEHEIFKPDKDDNIIINVYSLYRKLISYDHPLATPDKPNINNNRVQTFGVTRLKNPVTTKEGDIKKYNIPKGAGTYPFFPPGIIDKFERKEKIKHLILTEGYFKAFKGWMHGLDIVGLSSITHIKDKDTQALYSDIITLIKTCEVEIITFLYDGDCLDLSVKAFEKEGDLFKRPNIFFSSVKNARELLKDFEGLDIYFGYILSDSVKSHPKGLDDLLIAKRGEETDILIDINLFSKPGTFFYKINIKYDLNKLKRLFHIDSVKSFYDFHSEIIKEKLFVYYGTHYRYDSLTDELNVELPGESKYYIRVGDHYYEEIKIPDKHGNLQTALVDRQKGTITDDHGKNFIKHIKKYKEFCNLPSHDSYEATPFNCYNLYAPFEWQAEEGGSIEYTTMFLKHVFGDGSIDYLDKYSKKIITISELDIGLDYLQMLYQKPTQMLPILCFVSKENETGKDTFANWLKSIFKRNMVIVGNQEMKSQFTSLYISKLIVCINEAFIDKKETLERVKALSTGQTATLNTKQLKEKQVDIFMKFILNSNNEENFIYASNEDIRYWIRKLNPPEQKIQNLNKLMEDEIPAFLDFLNHRKIVTPCASRAWFDPKIIETDALRKVIEASRPGIEKEIYYKIKEMFLDFGEDRIYLTPQLINEKFFKNKYEKNYITKIIETKFSSGRYSNSDAGSTPKKFKYPYFSTILDYNSDFENTDKPLPVIKYELHTGRPFVFLRENFVHPSEENVRPNIFDNNITLISESESVTDLPDNNKIPF